MFSLPAEFYRPIVTFVIILMTIYVARQKYGDILLNGSMSTKYKGTAPYVLLIALIMAIFIGYRPVSFAFFGDSYQYNLIYEGLDEGLDRSFSEGKSNEGLFWNIMMWFHDQKYDINLFFTFVDLIYIGGIAFASVRLFPKYELLAFAMTLGGFQFYSFSVNGIRNGMATSLFLMALALVKDKRHFLFSVIICFIAIKIHNSLLLPAGSLIMAYFYRNTRTYIRVWSICLVLSLVVGNMVEVVFQNLGFLDDERTSGYLAQNVSGGNYWENKGYRWDFVLYSIVPMLTGYYFIVNQGFKDKMYSIILNIYIICNAFWLLVIRAAYTNRFAYLSWFLYGFVIIYPLIWCKMVNKRSKLIKYALWLNLGFTLFMQLIGK